MLASLRPGERLQLHDYTTTILTDPWPLRGADRYRTAVAAKPLAKRIGIGGST
jgi:hypothetical protein